MQELIGSEPSLVPLTLYTDSFVIKGRIRSRQSRITDILNHADEDFLVLTDTVVDEYGSREMAIRSEYAQVNLSAVLFAVADAPVEARPDMRTPKVSETAMISIPPFRVIGRIHLLPERDLHMALAELTGRFLPVTDAMYWSEAAGEARQSASMVAINHQRAQILAPHREVDPWAGLDRTGEAGTGPAAPSGGVATGEDPWGAGTGVGDPWGAGSSAADPNTPTIDPWGTGSGGVGSGAAPAQPAGDPAWPAADRARDLETRPPDGG